MMASNPPEDGCGSRCVRNPHVQTAGILRRCFGCSARTHLAGAFHFVAGIQERSSPKTGMRKFPHHEHFRPLGFAGQRRVRSDEDGKLVVVSARV